MRFAMLSLAIAAGAATSFAGSVVLGSSGTSLNFGTSGAVTVVGCMSSPCTITGNSVMVGPVTVNWSLVVPSPFTLVGTPSGNTALGTISLSSAATFTVTDSLGDDIVLTSSGTPTWSNTTGTTLFDITGSYTTVSLTGPGTTFITTELGSTPTVGETSPITVAITCGLESQCVTSADPVGSIVGVEIDSPMPATPEPATLGMLGGGLALLGFARKLRKS